MSKFRISSLERWGMVFGCSHEALALFRIVFGILLCSELVLRFRFLNAFYSDEGTLPLRLLLPKVDGIYKTVCIHCHFGSLSAQCVLLSIQVVAAFLYTAGIHTRMMSIISWYLYLSMSLRNTWLNFILDRYIHYQLFYSMFLPLDKCWCVPTTSTKRPTNSDKLKQVVLSPATVAFKLLIVWIYIDAGLGKLLDPLGGWSYGAKPLPALDSYTRHTIGARYMYSLLGPEGLRILTPTVVWVELLAAPVALLGLYLGWRTLVYVAVSLICSLHVGIAICLRNTVLLSLVACSAWCVYLPIGSSWMSTAQPQQRTGSHLAARPSLESILSTLLIAAMLMGNLWLDGFSQECDQSVRKIWSTLLHNRWNVFTGAEQYVTWEIAPGRLADGSVVDVWSKRDEVDWNMPGTGAPCTATARQGRWRSFPYLADLQGDDGETLWGYLCWQWDQDNNVKKDSHRRLIMFNFFMLQADVLPNMGFSKTRKRLIHTHECGTNVNQSSRTYTTLPNTNAKDEL